MSTNVNKYIELKYEYKYKYLDVKYKYEYKYPSLKYKYKYKYFKRVLDGDWSKRRQAKTATVRTATVQNGDNWPSQNGDR